MAIVGTPPVTVAVVSWNTRERLVRCLRSLAPEADAGRARVVVIDNGSSDGSAQAARETAPWAEVIEAADNLGFGAAVNAAAAQTSSPWLVCANADVELEAGALETLLAAAGDPRVGCVAPRLILPDGSTQHSVFPLPTLPFTACFSLGLHRLVPGLADRLCLMGHWDPTRGRDVPWAIGAFLLLRRQAFEEVGGFDERQWMYAEDLDLGWRLRNAGWISRYVPAARIHHASGAATGAAFGEERLERYMRATYAVILRRRGLTRTWLTAFLNMVGAAARVAWTAPLGLISPRWRVQAQANHRWLRAHRQGLSPRAAPERWS